MSREKRDRLNLLSAPWTVRWEAEKQPWSFRVVDSEKTPVASTYTEADAKLLALLPELADYLTEAMYEYCFNCRECRGLPVLDTVEVIREGCPEPNGKCFVQRWMNTLKKVQDAIKEGQNHEGRR